MPGKFQGEPAYAAKLYDMAMSGEQDETYVGDYDRQIDYWNIDAIDAEELEAPELENEHVILWEDDNGFVYTMRFESFDAAKAELTTMGVDDF